MKIEDIQMELERIRQENEALVVASRATNELFKKDFAVAERARENQDIDTWFDYMAKCQAHLKKGELIKRMLEDCNERARKVLVTLYGPLGNELFKAIQQTVEEAPD